MPEDWLSQLSRASNAVLTQIGSAVGRAPLEIINGAINKKGFTLHSNLKYGQLERQVLDLYLVKNPLGTLVFVHGGYWDAGSKDEYPFVADSLCAAGFNVAVVNYRLAPDGVFPRMVQDVALSIQFLLRELPIYGVTSRKLGLLGHSAGAHIIALLCVVPTYLEQVGLKRNAIAASVGISGPYDFLEWLETDPRAQKAMGAREQWLEAQPALIADGQNPPMLLLHGAKDTLCSPAHAPRLAHEIRLKGGTADWKAFENLDHFRIIGAFSRLLRFLEPKVLDDTTTFFKQHFVD